MKGIKTLCIITIAVALTACGQKRETKERVRSVKTEIVELYEKEKSVSFPGKVKASAEADLAFRVSGQISRVYAKQGQYVKEGQLLAELDPRDYEVQLAATEAEYSQIRNDAERIISLHEKGSVTQSDYDKAVFGLKQIEAKYDAHKNALADTRLSASFSGYVQKQMHDTGETISAGMPVFSVVNTASPEVEINIPANIFIERDNFQRFTCSVEAFPGREFPLKLLGISHKANLNQLFTARFQIEGGGNMPSPGMTATVNVIYKTPGSGLVEIPLSAVYENEGKSAVWIFDESSNTVSTRPVTLSEILANGKVIVNAGLSRGDVIVTAGVHSLKEGQTVKQLEQSSETNIGGVL